MRRPAIWRKFGRAASAAVRQGLRAAAPAYFAANVTIHNVLLWAQYARITTDSDSFGEILHRWYFSQPGDVRIAAPAPGTAPLSLTR